MKSVPNRLQLVLCSAVVIVLLGAILLQWRTARSGRLRIVVDRFPLHEAKAIDTVAPYAEPPEVTDKGGSESSDDGEAATPSAVEAEVPPTLAEGGSPVDEPPRASRWGTDDAKVQVQMFVNYHAPQTAVIEQALAKLSGQHPDAIAVDVRQLPPFPICQVCRGAHVGELAAGTCLAARAAEAAGMLKGSDGFRQMHRWLVAREGKFNTDELEMALREFQFPDTDAFLEAMRGKAVFDRIVADSTQARSQGVRGAPAVLVNGRQVETDLLMSKFNTAVVAALGGEPPPSRIALLDTPAFPAELQRAALLATVRVVNSRSGAEGSGTMVGHRDGFTYVLTAHHVVEGSGTLELHTFSEKSYPRPQEIYRAATVAAQEAEQDLALARFASSAGFPSLRICSRQSADESIDGKEVLTLGCSNGQAPTARLNRLLGSELIRRGGAGPTLRPWRLDVPSIAGRSGGALLHPDGCVLGVGSGIGEGQSYYCHLFAIREFLARSGYTWLLGGVK